MTLEDKVKLGAAVAIARFRACAPRRAVRGPGASASCAHVRMWAKAVAEVAGLRVGHAWACCGLRLR